MSCIYLIKANKWSFKTRLLMSCLFNPKRIWYRFDLSLLLNVVPTLSIYTEAFSFKVD